MNRGKQRKRNWQLKWCRIVGGRSFLRCWLVELLNGHKEFAAVAFHAFLDRSVTIGFLTISRSCLIWWSWKKSDGWMRSWRWMNGQRPKHNNNNKVLKRPKTIETINQTMQGSGGSITRQWLTTAESDDKQRLPIGGKVIPPHCKQIKEKWLGVWWPTNQQSRQHNNNVQQQEICPNKNDFDHLNS